METYSSCRNFCLVLLVFASVSSSIPIQEPEPKPIDVKEISDSARTAMQDFVAVVTPIAIAGGLAIGAGAGAFYLGDQKKKDGQRSQD